MKKILITGATGQIGTELAIKLIKVYGIDNVIATDIKKYNEDQKKNNIYFEYLDVKDFKLFSFLVEKYKIDTIIHLASLLSATAEKTPLLAWDLNMGGLINALEIAKKYNCKFFTPSSIGSFGPSTIKDNTPQDAIQRPNTMYGINKVAGELLCQYYFTKYGVDTRSVRFPGLISFIALPGGGTTDYSVDIYYSAIKTKRYTSYLKSDTYIDMMYMPDAIDSIIKLLETDSVNLIHRNAYNVSAMSFCPNDIFMEIKKHIPEFKMDYKIDGLKQNIADSWPNSIDYSIAIKEWGFNPKYDLKSMTEDMIKKLTIKLK